MERCRLEKPKSIGRKAVKRTTRDWLLLGDLRGGIRVNGHAFNDKSGICIQGIGAGTDFSVIAHAVVVHLTIFPTFTDQLAKDERLLIGLTVVWLAVVFPRKVRWIIVSACLLLGKMTCLSFSLLGPYANWMYETNGYHKFGDIGGPMDIGEGYRWNVPVVTYAFDRSFTDFFGSNGVAAVEAAIAILNDLPPASAVVLTNFPLQTLRVNFLGQADYDYDLKSFALVLLLEQMGIDQPTRNIFDLRQWDPVFLTQGDEFSWPAGTIPNRIVQRNFDPATLEPSHSVNGTYWSANVFAEGTYSEVIEFSVDPMQPVLTAVADFNPVQLSVMPNGLMQSAGYFYTGLTRDDVGGLAYLLNTNTLYFETLLSDVQGIGTNTDNYVNFAIRPGVGKITLVHQHTSTNGQFVAVTNDYTDTYITNNSFQHQSLRRIITQPDFLFSAKDLALPAWGYERTDTSRWWNRRRFQRTNQSHWTWSHSATRQNHLRPSWFGRRNV